ncbi:MAG: ammonia-forming cytochrome c nitrite reductase subunit c552 [Thermoplasmata archaeon]|nr:MAG: ammonia-forming cytochrome c nitrite reductase subunit c552 [Thermoplasmata archaeon]
MKVHLPLFFEKLKRNKKRILIYGLPPAIFLALTIVLIITTSPSTGEQSRAETDECIDCHKASGVLEGIIADWEGSVHAEENVTCIDCHEAAPTDPDAMLHNNYYISPLVSPKDCANCHYDEVEEFDRSLHAYGAEYYELLYDKQKLPYLESQIEGEYILRYGEELSHGATMRGCQACHGTNMTGKSTEEFTVWPNNGIGRINPDGSKGSCSSCHSRHSFSIAEARHPETCGQCHMGPDHPQIEIYMESKHGNIYSAEGDSWNWTKDEWQAGVDYRAPTCASCHMSSAGPGVPTTHDVSSRLSWELETEISKRTDNTANSLGYAISDGSSWQEKQARMMQVCKQCHSTTWVENFYEQADVVVELYNKTYLDTKEIVTQLYEDGLLTPESFDEPIEFEIYEMWHHEGRRARMGAFMAGPDYVQWHGFYDLLHDREEIEHMAEEIRRNATAQPQPVEEKDAEDETSYFWWLAILIVIVFILLIWNFMLIRQRLKMESKSGKKVVIKTGLDSSVEEKKGD